MPHRKLVKIGDSPKLPTIQEFFQTMAERQRDEIRRLKEEVAGQSPRESADISTNDPRKPVPDPWLLHPVRIKRTPGKKTAAKKSAGSKKTLAKPKKKSSGKRSISRKQAGKPAKRSRS